jgi:RNA polymerase sigma-70 factor (ECF subfamily)
MSVTEPGPAADTNLLELARAGSPVAYWKLVEGYRPYLKAVALNVLRGRLPSDGSDVVNDSLTIAFERLRQFQGSQADVFLGWVAAIVRNKALQLLKGIVNIAPLPEGADGAEVLPGSSSGPDARANKREQAARLMAALHRLRDDHRLVIELRNLRELSFREVGQRMGRSEDAVRQLWVRAMDKLKEEFGDDS